MECQRQLVSTLVDVAVEAADLRTASAAVSSLKQVFILHSYGSGNNYSKLF